MGESLAIERKVLPSLHRVVNVEVPHADDVLVDVELTKVPVRMPSVRDYRGVRRCKALTRSWNLGPRWRACRAPFDG